MENDIDTLRERLTTMLADITKELKTVGIHNPENPEDWIAIPEGVDVNEPDSDMTADIVEDWDERRALVATLEHEYNDITRALQKIKTGTYGTCEICGGKIEADRLNAHPSARTDKKHMDEEVTLSL